MNPKAYNKMDYTLCILSAAAGGKYHGCVVNSFHQVTSAFPAKFTVTVSRDNETYQALDRSGYFCVTPLNADCPSEIVDLFGYKSGRATDKFAAMKGVQTDENGSPYLTEHVNARISCKIVERLEIGRYVLFVGQATGAEVLSPDGSLTLQAFTDRGKSTPPQATVYRTAEINGYRCDICGYVYEGENPPAAGYRCPICKADHTHFHLIEK